METPQTPQPPHATVPSLSAMVEENFTRMVGTIGSGETNARTRRLVGEHARLPARAIPRFGTVTLTWPENIASASLARPSPTLAVISTGSTSTEVILKEWAMPVVRGRQRGIRTRFVCPRCGTCRDALHWSGSEWGCRGCFDLAYASRHRQRYCPAIARRARFLRKLARVPSGSLKARMLREMIAHQEAIMLASMKRVNRDLTKRRRRYVRRVDVSR
jgi:hypothetical protein